jgi:hypothetical protein
MYKHTLSLMSKVEEEVLRVATHHVERYAAQLYAAGRGSEVAELDQTALLDDVWAFEAGFCEARHKVWIFLQSFKHTRYTLCIDHTVIPVRIGIGSGMTGLLWPSDVRMAETHFNE